jgi:hypothetical protein
VKHGKIYWEFYHYIIYISDEGRHVRILLYIQYLVLEITVMVSVLASSAVDREFEHRSGQTKNYKIGICCFSAKHAALRRMTKDWLARNQNNVYTWGEHANHYGYFTGRRQSTKPNVNRWLSVVFFLEKNLCKETIQVFYVCMHHSRVSSNSSSYWNNVNNLFHYMHMLIKIYWKFYHYIIFDRTKYWIYNSILTWRPSSDI